MWGAGVHGKSLYLPLNFAINLKLLYRISLLNNLFKAIMITILIQILIMVTATVMLSAPLSRALHHRATVCFSTATHSRDARHSHMDVPRPRSLLTRNNSLRCYSP